MTDEKIKAGIAERVCVRFIKMHTATKRHQILVEFENLDVLNEMEQRNLIRASDDRSEYWPTVGTFALLGDDNQLYQQACEGFTRTAYALWNLYCNEDPPTEHDPSEFARYANKLYPDPVPHEFITLGLYLALEFGIVQPTRMSDNRMFIERFRAAEQVIKMRDPVPWWARRVQASREPFRPLVVPIEQLHATAHERADEEGVVTERYDDASFWSLIHPAVIAEARPRFKVGHYADAVEWALKVVAKEVRRRTGLKIDGSDLMHRAFSPSKPHLIFEDPIPSTQLSMQQGYMEVFAGAMTGIRNPKAHGMVQLDRRRCIHFLFLASLLLCKLDEAVDAP